MIPAILSVCVLAISVRADPIVFFPNGGVLGSEAKTFAENNYVAFRGVPYAIPPLRELRFQPPQAMFWDAIKDCTQNSGICFQTTSNSNDETEDCLYLNIFTPRLPSNADNVSFPVMIHIHGGGFVVGSGVGAPPDSFIDNEVLLVSINYRLGFFGFLSTEDDVIPGNNGLKDQSFAIKWVHDNIKYFGGDPDKITIFGQSAGSASVAYQLLNQENDGLIAGGILQSGSSLSPWAYQRDSRFTAFKTASFLDPSFETNNDSHALLEFFLTKDAKDLDMAVEQFYNFASMADNIEILQGFYYGPIVEVKNPSAFLTKKMYGLMKEGSFVKVPTLVGMTSEEELLFFQDPNSFGTQCQAFDENLEFLVPNDMLISDQGAKTEMGKAIRELYTGGEPLQEHLGDGIRYTSDQSFTRSILRHGEFASKLSDVYFYMFSYDGEMGNFNVHYDGAEAVTHGEDNSYVFCSWDGCDDSRYGEADVLTRQRMIKLWTDFAKYQNPTPEASDIFDNIIWPKLDTSNGDYLYLNINATLEIGNHPKDTYDGWKQLYDSLNYDDFDTY